MKLLLKSEIDLSNFSRNLSDDTCYEYDIKFSRIARLGNGIYLENMEKGVYSYIITNTSNIIPSKILDISEDGSKHLQIINQADYTSFLTGGEFCVTESNITFNVYSGVFEENTNYNMAYHENEFLSNIHTIFENHCNKVPSINFTIDKLT